MPKGVKGFIKGQSGNIKGKPKGCKNRETLLREERRAIFDKKISEKWEKTIDKLKPEYVADQFMGKAEEKIAMKVDVNPSPEIKELADKLNDIYRGTSKPSNGTISSSLGDKTPDKE